MRFHLCLPLIIATLLLLFSANHTDAKVELDRKTLTLDVGEAVRVEARDEDGARWGSGSDTAR